MAPRPSADFRERLVTALDAGLSPGEATRLFGVEVRALILAYPDATLPEHAARLETTTGIRLSPSHLSRVVRRLGLRLKKRA